MDSIPLIHNEEVNRSYFTSYFTQFYPTRLIRFSLQ
eukprot:COSAG02_NODE_193_length_29843_cov_30.519903_17_plen_36_part_00